MTIYDVIDTMAEQYWEVLQRTGKPPTPLEVSVREWLAISQLWGAQALSKPLSVLGIPVEVVP